MNLPIFDKCLLMLFVCSVVLVVDSRAIADLPPSECDTECRERRFFRMRSADGSFTTCYLFKYRCCTMCTDVAKGQCKQNPVEDKDTIKGVCKHTEIKQSLPVDMITTCPEMCPFPAAMVVARREAAEDDTTYSNVQQWQESIFTIWKCLFDGQYKNWADEDKKWK